MRVHLPGAVFRTVTRGKLDLMQDDDREHRMDDDSATRTESGEPQTQQAPVLRSLANPRRVRRA
jgi:hypothetical protein